MTYLYWILKLDSGGRFVLLSDYYGLINDTAIVPR